ncbi:hypothetical protein EDC38_2816 [Marinimicrobium koreense]|uniref:DUF2218 domain-containing protein n=1 Tax=Marinimicrobium koreense TaxID=306545 RepID=A0A3N1NTS9_9GAMM|nr:DUF2218 domain-containing protein [Marinimicrobium koreense]ROQ18588.1 hypothetical protein EDC38_2816 [Marinimicrobium koreense]
MQTWTSRAAVELPAPARTLRRLCKHFSHKVRAQWQETTGEVDFGIGVCEFHAEAGILHCLCRARSETDLQDIEETIERHLGPMSGLTGAPPTPRWQR